MTSSGWQRQRRCEYRQTTVQEPWGATYRLNSSETPVDYQLLVYEKGAFILHILRMMLTDLETGDDTRFRNLMRGFVRDHRQKPASTRSLEEAVTRAFGESM